MLGNDDGGPQLPVDLADCVQEIRCRDRIQLAGGLVQDQYAWLHGHDGSQVQKLFLATGKLCYILVEPALDAEIAGHFRHTETDGLLIHAKALKTKCQFMPYLVRDDLVVRILHNIADPG